MQTTGCRRLLALVEGLPEDAAVWRQDKPGWTLEAELAASQIEIADLWGRILAIVGGAKATALPKPVEITHPDRGGRPERPKPTTNPAEIARFFARI